MMNERPPETLQSRWKSKPVTSEVRILEDGRIMVNNLTPMMAEALSKLDPVESDFAERITAGR